MVSRSQRRSLERKGFDYLSAVTSKQERERHAFHIDSLVFTASRSRSGTGYFDYTLMKEQPLSSILTHTYKGRCFPPVGSARAAHTTPLAADKREKGTRSCVTQNPWSRGINALLATTSTTTTATTTTTHTLHFSFTLLPDRVSCVSNQTRFCGKFPFPHIRQSTLLCVPSPFLLGIITYRERSRAISFVLQEKIFKKLFIPNPSLPPFPLG